MFSSLFDFFKKAILAVKNAVINASKLRFSFKATYSPDIDAGTASFKTFKKTCLKVVLIAVSAGLLEIAIISFPAIGFLSCFVWMVFVYYLVKD